MDDDLLRCLALAERFSGLFHVDRPTSASPVL